MDEAKHYATNSTYELSDITAAALKLVSNPRLVYSALLLAG